MFAKTLIDLRTQYEAGTISDDEFRDQVNAVLNTLKTAPDAYKIAAFDGIADEIAAAFAIEDLSDGVQSMSSDTDHYVFERAVSEVMGHLIWDFFGRTYQQC